MSEPNTAAGESSPAQHHMDYDMSVAQHLQDVQGVNCEALQYDRGSSDQDQHQHAVAALQQAEPDSCKQEQQNQQLTPLVQMGLEAIDNRKKEIHVKVKNEP